MMLGTRCMPNSGFDTIGLRDGRLCRYRLDSGPLQI